MIENLFDFTGFIAYGVTFLCVVVGSMVALVTALVLAVGRGGPHRTWRILIGSLSVVPAVVVFIYCLELGWIGPFVADVLIIPFAVLCAGGGVLLVDKLKTSKPAMKAMVGAAFGVVCVAVDVLAYNSTLLNW